MILNNIKILNKLIFIIALRELMMFSNGPNMLRLQNKYTFETYLKWHKRIEFIAHKIRDHQKHWNQQNCICYDKNAKT
jgi:hypothetical protein